MLSGGLDMALTKYKIGQLISVVDERNSLGIREFYGININNIKIANLSDEYNIPIKRIFNNNKRRC